MAPSHLPLPPVNVSTPDSRWTWDGGGFLSSTDFICNTNMSIIVKKKLVTNVVFVDCYLKKSLGVRFSFIIPYCDRFMMCSCTWLGKGSGHILCLSTSCVLPASYRNSMPRSWTSSVCHPRSRVSGHRKCGAIHLSGRLWTKWWRSSENVSPIKRMEWHPACLYW